MAETVRTYDPGTDGVWNVINRVEEESGAERVVIDETDGRRWHGYRLGGVVRKVQQLVFSPVESQERTTAATAFAAERTRADNNAARIELIGKQAARFARDPAANVGDCLLPTVWASLSTAAQRQEMRKLHEMLARLVLATKADDQ